MALMLPGISNQPTKATTATISPKQEMSRDALPALSVRRIRNRPQKNRWPATGFSTSCVTRPIEHPVSAPRCRRVGRNSVVHHRQRCRNAAKSDQWKPVTARCLRVTTQGISLPVERCRAFLHRKTVAAEERNAVIGVSLNSAGRGIFQDKPVVVGAVEIVSQQDSFVKDRVARAVIRFRLTWVFAIFCPE